MLNIFNDMWPFFHDAYAKFSMSAYAEKLGVSIPTARTILLNLEREKYLSSVKQYNAREFRVIRGERYTKLLNTYWYLKIYESGLLDALAESFVVKSIVLFGSVQKAELTPQSDIDIAVIGTKLDEFDERPFEKKLGREIQLLVVETQEQKKTNVFKNIQKGYVLSGKNELV